MIIIITRIGKGSTYLLTSSSTSRVTGLIDSFYYSNVIPDGFGLVVYNKDSYEPTCPTTTPAPTTTPPPEPCGQVTTAGGAGVTNKIVDLEAGGGILVFCLFAYCAPDKLEIIHDGLKKATSSMAGANGGPFDNTYGDPTVPTFSQAENTVQFIGACSNSNGGNIPNRIFDFIADTGTTLTTSSANIAAVGQQLIWWKYDSADYSTASTATVRVTGPGGTAWYYTQLCTVDDFTGTTPCPVAVRQIDKLTLTGGSAGDTLTLTIDGVKSTVEWETSHAETLLKLGNDLLTNVIISRNFTLTVDTDSAYLYIQRKEFWNNTSLNSFTASKTDGGTTSTLTPLVSPVSPPWSSSPPDHLCVTEASIKRSCSVRGFEQQGVLLNEEVAPCLPHGTYSRANNAEAGEFFAWVVRSGPSAGTIKRIEVKYGGQGYINGGTAEAVPLELTGDGSNAAATCNIDEGVVTAITITNAGSGYTWLDIELPNDMLSSLYNTLPVWRRQATLAGRSAVIVKGSLNTSYPINTRYNEVNGFTFNDRKVYRSSHQVYIFFNSTATNWVIANRNPGDLTVTNAIAGVNGIYELQDGLYGGPPQKYWKQRGGNHYIYSEFYGGVYVWWLSEGLDADAVYKSTSRAEWPWFANIWPDITVNRSTTILYQQGTADFSPVSPWVLPWQSVYAGEELKVNAVSSVDTYWLFWSRTADTRISQSSVPFSITYGAWMITRGGLSPGDKSAAVVAVGGASIDSNECPELPSTSAQWYVPLGTDFNNGETITNYISEQPCDPSWLSSPWEPGGAMQAIKDADPNVESSFLVTTTTTITPTTTTAVPTTTTAVPTTTTAVPTTTTAVPTTTTAVPTTTTAVPTTTTAVPTTTTAVPTTTTAVPTTTTAVPTTTTAVPTTTTAGPTTTTAVPTTTAEPSPSLLKAGLMMRWFAWDDPDSARASSFGLSKNVEVDGSVSSRDVIYPSYKSSLWPNLTGAFTDATYITDFDSIAKSSTDVYGITKSGVYITDAQYLQLPQIQYNSNGGQWDSFGNDIGFLTGVETSSDDGFTLTFWSKWDYPDGWDPSAYIVDYNLYSLGNEGSAASLAHMMKYEGNDIEGILQSNGSNSIYAGNSKNTPPAPIIHTTGEVWTFWAFSYGGGTLAQGTPPIAGSSNDASENLLWAVSTGGLNENHIRFYNGSDSTRPSDGFDEGLTIGGNVMANKGTTEWLDFGASQAFLLGYGGSSSRVVPMTGYISDFRLYSGILQTGQIRDIYTGQGLV